MAKYVEKHISEVFPMSISSGQIFGPILTQPLWYLEANFLI